MAFTACSPARVAAGQNTIVEAAADPTGWDVQSVLVGNSGRGSLQAGAPARAQPVKTITWTDSSRVLRVRASQRSYLEVAQNFNAGWQATLDGRVLQPVQLDGWEQAWLLPAGTHGLVTLTYRPDTMYRAALFGGLALLALVIALALVPLHRRRRKTAAALAAAAKPPFASAGRTGRGVSQRVLLAAGATVGLVVTGLWLAGYAGALALPAATFLFMTARSCLARDRLLALRPAWRALASTWLVVGLMVVAAVGGAAGDWLRDRGDGGAVVSALWDVGPQLLCLLIVARIIAELPAAREWQRAGDQGWVSGPGEGQR
jgi:arabinofuranan 3-O-arabinosyltransferase